MDDSDGYKHGYSQDGTDCFLWLESVALTLMPSFSSCFFLLSTAHLAGSRVASTRRRRHPGSSPRGGWNASLRWALFPLYASVTFHLYVTFFWNCLIIYFAYFLLIGGIVWIEYFRTFRHVRRGNRAPSSSTSPKAAWALRMLRGANVSAGQFKLT